MIASEKIDEKAISVDLLGCSIAQFKSKSKPKVVAVYSFRYDADLVPALHENLAGVVDGFIGFDDRKSDDLFSSEPHRRRALLRKAKEIGADWVLAVDPDERFEPALKSKLAKMTSVKTPTVWFFNVRELYTISAYRSDGIWNEKKVGRLFALHDNVLPGDDAIHDAWVPASSRAAKRDSGINLYHLKGINPQRRAARRNLYAHLDPDREFNSAGYDYLADEAGIELTEIPEERMYFPPHEEDNKLWMADVKNGPEDPVSITLARAYAARVVGDIGTASGLIKKAARTLDPENRASFLADQYFRIGAYEDAFTAFREIASRNPKLPDQIWLKYVESARFSKKHDVLEQLLLNPPHGSDQTPHIELAKLRHKPPVGQSLSIEAFKDIGWCDEAVNVRWGRDFRNDAELSVVVIGLHAPKELRDAIQSLLDQSEAAQIIVVNSGTGSLSELLGDWSEQVISVEIPHPVYVGAARNIGAALANADHVAFLASDCTAQPGWSAARLLHHQNGHSLVASSMTTSHRSNPFAWAYFLKLYAARLPDTRAAHFLYYSLSYERGLFFSLNWFPSSLRIGEDTVFNTASRKIRPVIFARDVITEHLYSPPFLKRLIELIGRGRRSVRSTPVLRQVPLKRFNAMIPFLIITHPVLAPLRNALYRHSLRRGLTSPEPQFAFVLGEWLSIICGIAYMLGQLSSMPSELLARQSAYKLLKQCQRRDADITWSEINNIKISGYLGEVVITQLNDALKNAGYDEIEKNSW